MGLDMQLIAVIESDSFDSFDVVCSWGKSNQIFRWFDRHVCGGAIENCAVYDVTLEQVKRLLDDCVSVIEDRSKAPELLPTSDKGGLFGGRGYDKFYMEDVLYTRNMISDFLSEYGEYLQLIRYEFFADW